ncbi:aspartate--tRNA(Asn) ligase [Microlunatus sp. Gsoil 973]|uniref:aspartate--tRNA(Asn) ligase n=1 Tax=Microlunatus sp. Gsoil 973 TaxID=2672569 RepID=UPI0012B4D5A1|nr:aspartate--tRNA(Asn) ligase [Microlunatus sp. Gsoil 973]QGN34030.1 aspartate--tRNA(Asn) ligase [Microlunatus sp. Gsoil 973]
MIHHPQHRVLAAELPGHIGETVRLSGWVHRIRELKSVSFLIIRDRSGLAQIVITPPYDILGEESVVRIEGLVIANPQAPGGVEVTGPTIEVLSEAVEPPPFDLYRPTVPATLPTILDHAPTSLRHPRLKAGHALAAAAVAGFRQVLQGHGFTEIHTPKVVESATESGANVFSLDWFGRPAYLAQSPQFFKQMMVGVFERVYETGPVFRAEPHNTARHLAQYTSLDAEFGFIRDHQDVMIMVRAVIAGMVSAVGRRPAELDLLEARLPEVPEEVPQLHFADAMRWLGKDDVDLAPADERALSRWAQEEYGSEFLFITGYPMVKRPFYTHPEPGRPEYSNSFDLLFRGLELITGGQRLHRYRDYRDALSLRGEPLEPYASYLATFAAGMPPHGGFALGLERFVARLIGADNIRLATLFPRDLHRLAP